MCKANKYGVRFETRDGTLEDAFHTTNRKSDAVRLARWSAKNMSCDDVVRVWVDNLCEELGVASFTTKFA